MDTKTSRILIRTDPATSIIFSILFCPALILGLNLIWKGAQVNEGLLLCGLYFSAHYYMCSPTIELTKGLLVYRAFMKRISIELPLVRDVAIVSKPAPHLELSISDQDPPFSFIIKPFSKAGVAETLQYIRSNAQWAKFDGVSTDLCRGDFASVTRQTLSTRNILLLSGSLAGGSVISALLKVLISRH